MHFELSHRLSSERRDSAAGRRGPAASATDSSRRVVGIRRRRDSKCRPAPAEESSRRRSSRGEKTHVNASAASVSRQGQVRARVILSQKARAIAPSRWAFASTRAAVINSAPMFLSTTESVGFRSTWTCGSAGAIDDRHPSVAHDRHRLREWPIARQRRRGGRRGDSARAAAAFPPIACRGRDATAPLDHSRNGGFLILAASRCAGCADGYDARLCLQGVGEDSRGFGKPWRKEWLELAAAPKLRRMWRIKSF